MTPNLLVYNPAGYPSASTNMNEFYNKKIVKALEDYFLGSIFLEYLTNHGQPQQHNPLS